eukprot:COSAG01_NODE_4683_length_4818_cov_2.240305_7_plen_56_part_00
MRLCGPRCPAGPRKCSGGAAHAPTLLLGRTKVRQQHLSSNSCVPRAPLYVLAGVH